MRTDDGPGYRVGRHNIQIWGLDIDKVVFPVSALSVVVFVLATLLFPEGASQVLGKTRTWLAIRFNWLFMLTANFSLLFCLLVLASPLGKVRLGGRDAVPSTLMEAGSPCFLRLA